LQNLKANFKRFPEHSRKILNYRDVLNNGHDQDGIYQIYVPMLQKHVTVYCDQTTDGGGWLVSRGLSISAAK